CHTGRRRSARWATRSALSAALNRTPASSRRRAPPRWRCPGPRGNDADAAHRGDAEPEGVWETTPLLLDPQVVVPTRGAPPARGFLVVAVPGGRRRRHGAWSTIGCLVHPGPNNSSLLGRF